MTHGQIQAVVAVLLILAGVPERLHAGSRTVLIERNSSRISYDASDTQWVISTGSLDLTVGIADTGFLEIQRLAVAGKDSVSLTGEPESRLAIGRDERWLQDGKDRPVRFVTSRTDDYQGGIRLSIVFEDGQRLARITRHYVVYPEAPAFVEVWTDVERLVADEPIDVSVLAAWRVHLASRSLRWVRGLEAPAEQADLSFQRHAREVGAGESFSLSSWGRSTTIDIPFVIAPAGAGTFVGGLLWSGTWEIGIEGTATGTRLDANLRDIEIAVPANRAIESAHGFIGVVDGDEHGVSNAVGRFLVALRGGRGFPQLVTYNPWFVHGVNVNASTIDHELDVARAIGVEVFQVDAGWYRGAGQQDAYDFTSGVSSYDVDEAKFPEGLRGVGTRIRDLGMQFALWVEPERIDRSLVGRSGSVADAWLATTNGSFDPTVSNDEARSAQICLAHPDAWQWVLGKLTTLIDANQVDYLKIDSNFWVNCSRDGHGHGARDGNYWHVQGLYSLLKALRERFPALIIENCAGGGNRIDLGLARYTDVAWMDDRTAPSAHVRHNLEGLLWFLPPSYLLGYTMSGGGEAMDVSGDLAMMIRSRMPGVLGFSYRFDELTEFDVDRIAHEVAIYRKVRDTLGGSAYGIVLSQQVTRGTEPPWDVVEHVGRDTGGAVIFAYQNASDVAVIRVVPRDLQAAVMYEIYSVDRGVVGRESGASLMRDGFEIAASEATRGHAFLLTPSGTAPSSGTARK